MNNKNEERHLNKCTIGAVCLMMGLLVALPLSAIPTENRVLSVGQQATFKVQGQVTDNNKEPLVGVVVSTEDGKSPVRVITDIDGMFTIDVPQGTHSLTFSYIGFKKHTERVSGSKVINVMMEEETNSFMRLLSLDLVHRRKHQLLELLRLLNLQNCNLVLLVHFPIIWQVNCLV